MVRLGELIEVFYQEYLAVLGSEEAARLATASSIDSIMAKGSRRVGGEDRPSASPRRCNCAALGQETLTGEPSR